MEPIPFYQVFTAYEARENQKWEDDLFLMRSMYPRAARKVLKEVEEECDKLEYKDSFMFHENPDRVRIDALSGKIYNRLININEEEKAMKAQSFLMPEPEFLPPWSQSGPGGPQGPGYNMTYPSGTDGTMRKGYDYIYPLPPKPQSVPQPPLCYGNCPPLTPDYKENGDPDWLKQLITVLLLEEMSRRRQRYFQRGRWS